MQAALDNFQRITHPHKMVILGAMRELGNVSEEAHRQVAAQAFASGIEAAWFVGKEFRQVLQDVPATDIEVRSFDDVEAVKAAIAEQAPTERLILIKGSNSTKLHQLPDIL